MKNVFLFIIALFSIACVNNQSLEGTEWVSIGKDNGRIIMKKRVYFNKDKYFLTIINYASLNFQGADTTFVTGKYIYAHPDLIFYYDNSERNDKASIKDDTMIIKGVVDDSGFYTFVKQ